MLENASVNGQKYGPRLQITSQHPSPSLLSGFGRSRSAVRDRGRFGAIHKTSIDTPSATIAHLETIGRVSDGVNDELQILAQACAHERQVHSYSVIKVPETFLGLT